MSSPQWQHNRAQCTRGKQILCALSALAPQPFTLTPHTQTFSESSECIDIKSRRGDLCSKIMRETPPDARWEVEGAMTGDLGQVMQVHAGAE